MCYSSPKFLIDCELYDLTAFVCLFYCDYSGLGLYT